MNRIVIPHSDWSTALVEAVRNADGKTIIIVDTEVKKLLGLRAADRFHKTVTIEVQNRI
ncbi:MAG: hypothetical protein Q8R40_00170 [bacterium]|nr:hypothetical protein [bacterium]